MKAKTVWNKADFLDTRLIFWIKEQLYWLTEDDEMWCSAYADIRWVNCYGHEVGDLGLDSGGKIIGDE